MKGMPTLTVPMQHNTGSYNYHKQEKEIKDIYIGRSKIVLFFKLCTENIKDH